MGAIVLTVGLQLSIIYRDNVAAHPASARP